MPLISKSELASASGLDKLGFIGKPIASMLMNIVQLNRVNSLYEGLKDKEGEAFFDALFSELGVKYLAYSEDLAKIPKEGPFVLVANHPLGALDGIIMIKLITSIRPDFKIMGNFLLNKIKPLQPYVIGVNPFETRKEAYSSVNGMRQALEILADGGCFGAFPAGEVSNKSNPQNTVMDKLWERPLLKLIQKAEVPVIPMYFHAQNSRMFYRMSKIHPDLQTIMLPSEMLRKRKNPINIRIGRRIFPKVLKEYESPEELGEFLRNRVYMMRSYYEKRKKITDYLKIPNLNLKLPMSNHENVVPGIIPPTDTIKLMEEIARLKASDKMLFNHKDYEIYFSEPDDIPYIMREIGRQRELTFRQVGEGTNMPFDLDQYDKHYRHLFLWDAGENKLVGAYRIGLGSEIMKEYGIDGFYTSSLFIFDRKLEPFFAKAIEMGRAYIMKEYQLKALPLYLLWRGIVHVCLRWNEHKYLMGGVSISNQFSDFSKALIIEFMQSHYYDRNLAQYVQPRKAYKLRLKEEDKKMFFEGLDDDLNKFDKLIDDFEPQLRMPVLIKKYIKQNAMVIAFNVDPSFNDAIDGLMYIKISNLPESTIEPVLAELAEAYKAGADENATDESE